MKYYTSTTEFNCGIDLHARQMYVCLMDRQGKKLVHTNVKDNDFEFFLKLVQPYRHSLTVCCECMFGWYWLADACQDAGLTFVLAHALYVRAIHGGKNKNDRVDSEKLAHLLRSNLIPPAYVYPAEKRPLRALLRQRIFYVWRRSELLARLQSHQLAHNRAVGPQTRRNRDPWEQRLLAALPEACNYALQTDRMRVVVTGGPGSGKTTLVEALGRRGYATVPEAAIQVIEAKNAELGVEGRPSSPKELADFYASETRRWTQVVERAKIPKQ